MPPKCSLKRGAQPVSLRFLYHLTFSMLFFGATGSIPELLKDAASEVTSNETSNTP